MQTFRTALEKNRGAAIVAFVLLLFGFIVGLSPKIGGPIIEEAGKVDTSAFSDVIRTTGSIFLNNFLIAVICTFGGLALLPTLYYSVFGIGVVYGALASHMAPANFFITLGVFGLLELLALFFSIVGGLLFPKYLASKILGYPSDLKETASQSFFFFILAAGLLVLAAFLEACLLYVAYFNPSLLLGVSVLGFLITALVFYVLFR